MVDKLDIRLTPEQRAALERYTSERGIDISDFVRRLLFDKIPYFPLNNQPRGNPALKKGVRLNPAGRPKSPKS